MQPMSPLPPLVLASASPRRRVMLSAAGVAATVVPADLPEVPSPGEAPPAFALRVALEKAAAARSAPETPRGATVLAADTVVTVEGRILGKPRSAAEALEMLATLAGRSHEVWTAFAVDRPGETPVTGLDRTRVTFRPLESAEMADYVASGEPMDKAGAYGIQGLAGSFVESVEGAYDTVVGLPVGPVLEALEAAGVVRPRSALARRVAVIRARIAAATQAVGRSADEVTLVAVGKTQPADAIAEMVDAGVGDIGENYVQEFREKAASPALAAHGPAVRWHFIGHLQSNKAKYLAPTISAVHSVDSKTAAAALDREMKRAGRRLDVCIQVNLAGEARKSGIAPEALTDFLTSMAAFDALDVRGLMTVPPDGRLCDARRHFAALRTLRDAHASRARPLAWLSMGMSGDFDQAIAEGATHVRVGTALFGPRPPVA
jgi:MAF protein